MATPENQLCERCGFKYGLDPVHDCHPGDCKVRPLPELRAGRDKHGRYFPAARAMEYRGRVAWMRGHALELARKADRLLKQAEELEQEASRLDPLGSVMWLPEVTDARETET